MKRIDINIYDGTMEDLLYHLSRYKFIARLSDKNWDMLEIGCGNGYGAWFLSKYINSIIACDQEKSVIDNAKSKFYNENLRYEYEIINKQYDAITCLEVIEHLTQKDGIVLLNKIYNLLKVNGIAFISTPRKIDNPTENRKKHHLHEYSYEEYKLILQSVFQNVLIFSQTDEIISTQNKDIAWNYVAICFKGVNNK